MKVDMERFKRLEAEVLELRAKDWKAHPKLIDGVTIEYFTMKEKVNRYKRMNARGFPLTMDQINAVRDFDGRYRNKFNG